MLIPSKVRMSKNFLLSDFMGCDSVYRGVCPNIMLESQTEHLAEGKALCENILEPILRHDSRISISYGYISDELSRAIVKYQDPTKPSYHRWDAGAAADIVFHDTKDAPIYSAFWVDDNTPSSRIITYAESPFVCVGCRKQEVDTNTPRKALYENRYTGDKKPKFITYPQDARKRETMKETIRLPEDWRGQGYPSYHGGGREQLHHIRTSKYTMLSDFLYNDYAVSMGEKNVPYDLDSFLATAFYVGGLIDRIYEASGVKRINIVEAYESGAWGMGPKERRRWLFGHFRVGITCADEDFTRLREIAKQIVKLPHSVHRETPNVLTIEGKMP